MEEFFQYIPIHYEGGKVMYTNSALDSVKGPVRVIYEPTIHCNLRCPMCDRTHKTEYEEHKNAPLQKDKALRFLNDIVAAGSTHILLIGGGEPLMHSDIHEYIECIKQNDVHLHLWTNGTLITEKNANFLANYCDMITVSLDSPHEEINDQLRGVEGATKRTINGLKLLRNENTNLYLRIHSVLSARNIPHLNDFLPLIEKVGINEVGGALVNPFSFVPENFLIAKEKQSDYFHKIDLFCQELKKRDIALAGYYNAISKNIINKIAESLLEEGEITPITCLGLWSQATVRPNGDVSVCCFSYKPILGNLHKNTFNEIWNSKRAEELREKVYNGEYLDAPCKGCDLGNPVFTRLLNSGEDMVQFNNMINTSR